MSSHLEDNYSAPGYRNFSKEGVKKDLKLGEMLLESSKTAVPQYLLTIKRQ
jgi:hypothetical protein